jgi:cytochrome c-type biogenesis protein
MPSIPDLMGGVQGYLQAGSPLAYLAAFAGGLLASLTPCVYPVIPVTVGYIGSRTAGSPSRALSLSLAYVLGMALTYAALGTAAALTGKLFGTVAASPVPYLVVGNICLLLGLSLLDVFHLPYVGAAASRPGRPGTLPGAFGVGAASGLVMGPCTAPILGALLLFVGSRRNVLFGTSLLFVFALGMGLLVVLAGAFAGFLAGLPRSGAWLERVRQGFGVLMLLAAEALFVQAGRLVV